MTRALVMMLVVGWSCPCLAAGGGAGVEVGDGQVGKGKAKAKARRKGKRKRRKRGPITVPVDLGIGPAVHMITGPLQDDQTLHYGLKISLEAIIGRDLILQNLHRVPKKYRSMAKKQTEVRFRPGVLAVIPDTLYVSPRNARTAMYGANWRLLGVGTGFGEAVRLALGARLNVTYAYIDSEDPKLGTTHLLRPGLSADAELEVPLAESFLVSLGWSSCFYPPQTVGGPVFEWGEVDESVWHVGQAFLKLHFRFPYTTTL